MSSQKEGHPDYLSYLLRLRYAHRGDGPVWRVSLEEPLTEQVHRFNDLHSLFAFLLARTEHAQSRQDGGREPAPTVRPAIEEDGWRTSEHSIFITEE